MSEPKKDSIKNESSKVKVEQNNLNGKNVFKASNTTMVKQGDQLVIAQQN